MDGRKRSFVALHLDTLRPGGIGWALRERFGNDGIVVWAALLIAAKESDVEGSITYEADDDLWAKLGVDAPPFTAKEFFDVTGARKWTRRKPPTCRLRHNRDEPVGGDAVPEEGAPARNKPAGRQGLESSDGAIWRQDRNCTRPVRPGALSARIPLTARILVGVLIKVTSSPL